MSVVGWLIVWLVCIVLICYVWSAVMAQIDRCVCPYCGGEGCAWCGYTGRLER